MALINEFPISTKDVKINKYLGTVTKDGLMSQINALESETGDGRKAFITFDEKLTIDSQITIPENIILNPVPGAIIDCSSNGQIEFQGKGLANLTGKTPIFRGLSPSGIGFTGINTPESISLEIFDTESDSLNERFNLANEAFLSKFIEIHAYPRVIGSHHSLLYPNAKVIFHPGLYQNIYNLALLNRESESNLDDKAYVDSPFTFRSNCIFEFLKGAVMQESPTNDKGAIFAPQYIHNYYENVEFINPSFVSTGGVSTSGTDSLIVTGNTKNFKVRNLRSEKSDYYVLSAVGGGNVDRDFIAADVEVDGFEVIDCFSQAINPIRVKGMQIRNGKFVYNYPPGGGYSGVGFDFEPNGPSDLIEKVSIENVEFHYNFSDNQRYPLPFLLQGVSKRIADVDIINCRVYSNEVLLGGIKHFVQAYGVDGLRIKDNKFDRCYESALNIAACDRVEESGNTYNNCHRLAEIEAVANSRFSFSAANNITNPSITETERFYPVLINGTKIVTAFPIGINDNFDLFRFYYHYAGKKFNFNDADFAMSNIEIPDDNINYDRRAISSVDYQTRAAITFAPGDIAGNTINKTAHALKTGTPVMKSSSGIFPALTATTAATLTASVEKLWIIRNTADSFSFAETLQKALDGNALTITNAGTGSHSLQPFAYSTRVVSSAAVNTATNEIEFGENHNLVDKAYIRYEKYGGAAIGGLTDGQVYFVQASTDTAIKLAASLENLEAGIFIDLTSADVNAKYIFTPVMRTEFSNNQYKVESGVAVKRARNSRSVIQRPVRESDFAALEAVSFAYASANSTLIHAINCGKPDGAAVGIWEPDDYFTGGSAALYNSPNPDLGGFEITSEVANYIRFSFNSTFTYNIPGALPNSLVLLKLYFFVFDNALGDRFSVLANGKEIIAGYDIVEKIGNNKVAEVRGFATADAAGRVKIVFSGNRQSVVSGIKVFQIGL